MDVILGIDLGTTNSEVAVIRSGRPEVLADENGPILPSVVGLDPQGGLLVGRAARNQYVLAPERTVRSIKRKMGQELTVKLGQEEFTPQEISAIILRTLKARAEKVLGHPVAKAVITVPAFFTEAQREATREAGELAGLEVMRIINEPTAAVLTYDPHPPEMERLLVYDLGGGTFDVSIAQVEAGVVEILSSHGDTQLGGDDFDQRLLDFVCGRFQEQHGIDLRQSLAARSRLLHAVEEAKMRLSSDAVVTLSLDFIAEKDGVPLNLVEEISRQEYERLIEPLLAKTLRCIDMALDDAQIQAPQIDKVLLVGGATRTPLVHQLLTERLGRPVHSEIEPDLAVAMGAAVQGGLIAGIDVGPVLVDITPHSLGIEALGYRMGVPFPYDFVAVINRNTPLPTTHTKVFTTSCDRQKVARIKIFQGEEEDTNFNSLVGEFLVEGLAPVPAPNEILVRFDLDPNGILKVTATERSTGLERHVVIDSMMERFRKRERAGALARLEQVFAAAQAAGADTAEAAEPTVFAASAESEITDPELKKIVEAAQTLMARARQAESKANAEDATELRGMLGSLEQALARRSQEDIERLSEEVEDLVFYLDDR